MEVNLESLLTSSGRPELVDVIETLVGNRDKYEPGTGASMLDQVLPGNVRYLADYGFVPSTVSTDGEPLDIMVATYDPVFPGRVVRARVIDTLGVVMATKKGMKLNVFSVPKDDPYLDDIETLDNMPEQNLREIKQFFAAYKRLGRDEEAEVWEWRDLEEVYEIISRYTC